MVQKRKCKTEQRQELVQGLAISYAINPYYMTN